MFCGEYWPARAFTVLVGVLVTLALVYPVYLVSKNAALLFEKDKEIHIVVLGIITFVGLVWMPVLLLNTILTGKMLYHFLKTGSIPIEGPEDGEEPTGPQAA